jgi:hypothetical protein
MQNFTALRATKDSAGARYRKIELLQAAEAGEGPFNWLGFGHLSIPHQGIHDT